MPRPSPRAAPRALLALVAAALVLVGCGGSSDGPETRGPRDQAVEQLRSFGLSQDEATCVVDELGPDTVIEAADLNALAESKPYRDAAEACIGDD